MIISGMMIDVGSPALLAAVVLEFAEVADVLEVVDPLPTTAADVQAPVWAVTEAFPGCADIIETVVVTFSAAVEWKARQMVTRTTIFRQAIRCIAMIVDGMSANI